MGSKDDLNTGIFVSYIYIEGIHLFPIMINFIISVFASVTLLIGLISMVTPIPGGTILIAVSLTALICSSSRARRCLKILRTKLAFLNNIILWVEDKVRIRIVNDALRQTRPGVDSGVSCDVRGN